MIKNCVNSLFNAFDNIDKHFNGYLIYDLYDLFFFLSYAKSKDCCIIFNIFVIVIDSW